MRCQPFKSRSATIQDNRQYSGNVQLFRTFERHKCSTISITVDTDRELPVCGGLAELCQVCNRIARLVHGWSGTEVVRHFGFTYAILVPPPVFKQK